METKESKRTGASNSDISEDDTFLTNKPTKKSTQHIKRQVVGV